MRSQADRGIARAAEKHFCEPHLRQVCAHKSASRSARDRRIRTKLSGLIRLRIGIEIRCRCPVVCVNWQHRNEPTHLERLSSFNAAANPLQPANSRRARSLTWAISAGVSSKPSIAIFARVLSTISFNVGTHLLGGVFLSFDWFFMG